MKTGNVKSTAVSALIGLGIALVQTAGAQTLITATAAYASTQNGAARGATNAINNSGLSGPPYDLASTHTWGENNLTWQTNTNTVDGNWIAFDLGGSYNLTDAHVWNYRQGDLSNWAGRSMKNIDVYVSSLETPVLPTYATVSGTTVTQGQTISDANLLALGGGDDWTRVIDNHTLLRVSTTGSPEPVQSFGLAANNARWVLIRVDGGIGTGNYGDSSSSDRTGLFEVKFTAGTGTNPYDTWAGNFAPADLSDQGGDNDNDGVTNFEEFAFGLDPTSGASVNPIVDIADLATLGQFSYTRLADSGLTYTVWVSTDLQDWGTEPAAVNEEAGAPNGNGVETVLVELISPPAGDKVFVRVKAE